MSSPLKRSGKGLSVFMLLGVVSVFMATTPYDAEARGARGGGGVSSGGFSRSSPASGGSLSTPSAAPKRAGAKRNAGSSDGSMGAGQPNTARNAGDVGSPRGARSAGDVGEPRSARSAGGVDTSYGVGSSQGVGSSAGRPRDVATAAEMAEYRRQFARQNESDGSGSVDWDRRRQPVDPAYGVPENRVGEKVGEGDRRLPGAGALVVGAPVARAAAIERADDYYGDYVNTVEDPSYLAEDECSIKAVAEVNDVKYYRCSNAWYKRGYQGGSVVYIPTDTPPGY